MTKNDMYDALLHACRYKSDGCYPSTRYTYKDCEHTQNMFDYFVNNRKETMSMFGKDITVNVGDKTYYPITGEINTSCDAPAEIELSVRLGALYEVPAKPKLSITNVIFNPPATIVFWSDHTKTVVKCDTSLEKYDPEKGLAMAISRKMLGDNKREYYNIFLHWTKKWNKQNEATKDIKIDIPKNYIENFAESVRSTLIIDDLLP